MKSRKRLIRKSVLGLLVVFLVAVSTGCDYGRMYDQDSVKTYERKMPTTDKRSVPIRNGLVVLSNADPRGLRNPLLFSKEIVEHGTRAYNSFCIPCHGPKLDGNGTVGQSFAPLPTDLTSRTTLSQKDGELYTKARLGFKRHPVLFATVSAEDAWAVIIYMRSMGK